jgi:hypothetical protein
MARLRRKDRGVEDVEVPVETEPDVRHRGPWDASEKSAGDDPAYVDLGSLQVRGRAGLSLQLPTEGDEICAVMLVTEDAALELRAFAATRSGGLWDEVRADLETEVERLGGTSQPVPGLFGTELHIRVPAQLPDGEEAFQPSRIVGIEGPRWLLRATFLGDAALNPSDEGLLMDALRDVIVVRGEEARIPREALLLTLPENAVPSPDEE